MKKIIGWILVILLVVFLIPIFFTKGFKTKQVTSELEQNNVTPPPISNTLSDTTTIKLLHAKTNEIEEVGLEEYLCHVVSAEMPADYDMEALKAQAIVARTYTIYKIANNEKKHNDASICDSAACCQAWISKEDRLAKWEESVRQSNWDKIVSAIEQTQKKIITYDNQPINAFFHSNSGGMTEAPINVWGGSGYPYLQAVATGGEDSYTQYSSEVSLSKEEFLQKIKEKHPDVTIDFTQSDCLQIKEKTEGNRVKTMKVGNLELAGVEMRTLLGLRSANFEFSIQADTIKFNVVGYGHGVGMSQTGADALAKEGKTCEEIIKHFYTGVEIQNLP